MSWSTHCTSIFMSVSRVSQQTDATTPPCNTQTPFLPQDIRMDACIKDIYKQTITSNRTSKSANAVVRTAPPTARKPAPAPDDTRTSSSAAAYVN